MPKRATRACRCGGRIRDDVCDRCGPVKRTRQVDRIRRSASRRGYGRDWQRFRKAILARRPLCHDCEFEGLAVEAIELHHVKKVADHSELRLDPDNVLPLCKACHSRRTSRGE